MVKKKVILFGSSGHLGSFINKTLINNNFVVKTPSRIEVNEILNKNKIILNSSKILLMGVAYKKDISDMRESPAIDIAELLLDKDVDISYYDPYVEEFKVSGHIVNREVDTNSFKDYDMLLVLTPHSNFAQLDLNNLKTIIFDTTGSDFINSTERI